MIRINLLPEEERKKRIRKGPPTLKIPSLKIPMVPQTIWMVATIGAIVVILLGVYIGRRLEQRRLTREIGRMQQRLTQLKREADLVRNLEAKEKDLRSRLDIINRLNRDRFLRVKMLDDLCSRVPEYIWLTSFEEVSSNVKIAGLAFSNLTVAKFITDLSQSEYFSNPELVVLRKKTIGGQDVMEFSLTAGLRGVSPPEQELRRPRRGGG